MFEIFVALIFLFLILSSTGGEKRLELGLVT